MIRVNLLRTTGMSASAPTSNPFGGGAPTGGTAIISVDSEKAGGAKLAVILIFPILLYAYEYMTISELEVKKTQVTNEATAIEGKRSAYGDAGPRVEKYKKEKERIDTQLNAIRELTKDRLRVLKTLDTLQTITNTITQVWFNSIKIEGPLVKVAGYSLSDEGLNTLFTALNSSPFFSKLVPLNQEAAQENGQRVVKFQVEFTIGRGEGQ